MNYLPLAKKSNSLIYVVTCSNNLGLNLKNNTSLNAVEKPPYSYLNLIGMIFKNSSMKPLTSSEICKFICKQFPYYKQTNKKFKNNVKKCLSSKECFIKLPGPGRNASYWKIDPNCLEMFPDNLINEQLCESVVENQEASINSNNTVQLVRQRNIIVNVLDGQPISNIFSI